MLGFAYIRPHGALTKSCADLDKPARFSSSFVQLQFAITREEGVALFIVT